MHLPIGGSVSPLNLCAKQLHTPFGHVTSPPLFLHRFYTLLLFYCKFMFFTLFFHLIIMWTLLRSILPYIMYPRFGISTVIRPLQPKHKKTHRPTFTSTAWVIPSCSPPMMEHPLTHSTLPPPNTNNQCWCAIVSSHHHNCRKLLGLIWPNSLYY